jgi:hypothetical protein
MKPLLAQLSHAVPTAVANDSIVRDHEASQSGCFGMCCFKSLFAALTAMRSSFALAAAIITQNSAVSDIANWSEVLPRAATGASLEPPQSKNKNEQVLTI